MLFAIDIDGTLARQPDRRGYARYFNRQLELGISESFFDGMIDYQQFSCRPEVQVFLGSEEGKATFEAAGEQAQFDPILQAGAVPLPGAVQGAQALADRGEVIYVTCRKASTQSATSDWLARYSFPEPSRVYCCEQFYEKYLHCHAHAEPNEYIFLVDDLGKQIIGSFRQLIVQRRRIALSLYRRLSIIVFGQQHLPPVPHSFKVPVGKLDEWHTDKVQQLLVNAEQEAQRWALSQHSSTSEIRTMTRIP